MAKAYKTFQSTYKRSLELIKLYNRLRQATIEGETSPLAHNELRDLLRSAVVLSVSAMDAYFTNKFIDILIPFLKKSGATPDLVKLLTDAGLDTKQALEMITMERPWRRVRTLMDAHFETYTTQRAAVIDELFLGFGLKDFTKNAQGMAGRKNLLKRIESFVQRRHAIVHEGDLNSHGKLCKIEAKTVEKQVKELGLFIDGAEALCAKICK